MHEARITDTDAGQVAQGDGWFVLSVPHAAYETIAGGGSWCAFEAEDVPHTQVGIGVHVLWPGDRMGMYHAESEQEGFLILSGECLGIIEGEERPLRQWDYFHSPAQTRHILVGAGKGPCAILCVGGRSPDTTFVYPPEPLAARHGASTAVEVTSSAEAYAGLDRTVTRVRAPWPEPSA